MSEKKYGGYTSAELDHWEKLPMPIRVLTSSPFGAWLMRRDENRDRQRLNFIREEIEKIPGDYGSNNLVNGAIDDVLKILDKYMGANDET